MQPAKRNRGPERSSTPSHKYAHSEGFARLKATKESIKENLTTYQYLSVMDDLLYRAVGPLVESTRFLDNYLAQILAWATQHPKRKISGVDRVKLGALITLFFLVEDGAKRLKIVRQMKLDRTILLEALRNWTRLAESYITSAKPDLLLAGRRTLVEDIQDLALVYHTVTFWYAETLSYKNKILEKYMRLCLTTAQRDYVDLGHQVDLEDMVQIYLLTASKAIDKCDADRGVLTNHISNWLMSAKNVAVATLDKSKTPKLRDSAHQDVVDGLYKTDEAGGPGKGNSYASPNAQAQAQAQAQTHADMDDESGVASDASLAAYREDESRHAAKDTAELIQRASRVFDPCGIGRLSLGIGQWLSEGERQTLRDLALP